MWIVTALLVLLCANLAWAQQAERVWTDQQGRQITARLLRVEGDVVVLREVDRDTRVPFGQLSADDQAYLRGDPAPRVTAKYAEPDEATPPPPLPPPRIWNINGREVTASWLGADEGAYYLQGVNGELRVNYSALTSEADAREVVATLADAGRSDLAEIAAAAFERNTGKPLSNPSPDPAEDPSAPADADASPTPDPISSGIGPAPPRRRAAAVEDVKTADELFAEQGSTDQAAVDQTRFKNRVLLGGIALVVLIIGVLGYGFIARPKSS
jgi:hypothetical protein